MTDERLRQLLAIHRDGLLESTVPFWLRHAVDREHGGFLNYLDQDGTVLGTDKPVWVLCRFTWLLALLHNEVEPRTLTAILVQAADAVSAARPGARREAVESYVRRLERLEELAGSFDGVERVFAMQAGREVRVVVDPGSVDDLHAADLARRIARRLEEDLQYPGQIQVTVIRELRATD